MVVRTKMDLFNILRCHASLSIPQIHIKKLKIKNVYFKIVVETHGIIYVSPLRSQWLKAGSCVSGSHLEIVEVLALEEWHVFPGSWACQTTVRSLHSSCQSQRRCSMQLAMLFLYFDKRVCHSHYSPCVFLPAVTYV